MRRIGYDPKCYDLAEYFLSEYEPDLHPYKGDLVKVIEDTIHMWIHLKKNEQRSNKK